MLKEGFWEVDILLWMLRGGWGTIRMKEGGIHVKVKYYL